MALFQLSRHDEATTELRKASDLLSRARGSNIFNLAPGGGRNDLLIAEVLYREAQAVLQDAAFQAHPFMPVAPVLIQ